jgi:hypothetical protein
VIIAARANELIRFLIMGDLTRIEQVRVRSRADVTVVVETRPRALPQNDMFPTQLGQSTQRGINGRKPSESLRTVAEHRCSQTLLRKDQTDSALRPSK